MLLNSERHHDKASFLLVCGLKLALTVNTQQAAEILGLSPNTLNQWRHIKRGPAFHKFGKSVRYSLQELEDYMEQTRRERTSRFGDQSY